ncbi:hydrogenase nickel incorporation protein HypB [Frigoriglobus tundricola]|uniref:[NiFe] hydrogenase nickel incorporation-associated protein HypB n=1 Tax=Frigoriglobus tundricola TaxID=2774151 RepID=A0A6M5YLZ1_9BACT|nr:hydrogenase nickel incorporation protein HypB [Frigoriglobus tundricola]QJW94968.1 [NiFe] hydrogenase nickel incorporation-associated protein HypB [Frigoriglobus tundricola]
MSTPRILEVRKGLLKKNDELAAGLRARFAAAGTFVVNLVSSPGTGKTLFLERTLAALRARGCAPAALVGDLETDNDAVRLARSGAPVRQINTHGICHLEADMVGAHLAGWDLAEFDFLFVENVGNLVCTSSYDLGERLRVVLLSVTEGEDKPLKYPTLFNTGDVAVITKWDLAAACEFDRAAAWRNVHAVRPGLPILEVSAKTGYGMDAWLALLEARRGAAPDRAAAPVPTT